MFNCLAGTVQTNALLYANLILFYERNKMEAQPYFTIVDYVRLWNLKIFKREFETLKQTEEVEYI